MVYAYFHAVAQDLLPVGISWMDIFGPQMHDMGSQMYNVGFQMLQNPTHMIWDLTCHVHNVESQVCHLVSHILWCYGLSQGSKIDTLWSLIYHCVYCTVS